MYNPHVSSCIQKPKDFWSFCSWKILRRYLFIETALEVDIKLFSGLYFTASVFITSRFKLVKECTKIIYYIVRRMIASYRTSPTLLIKIFHNLKTQYRCKHQKTSLIMFQTVFTNLALKNHKLKATFSYNHNFRVFVYANLLMRDWKSKDVRMPLCWIVDRGDVCLFQLMNSYYYFTHRTLFFHQTYIYTKSNPKLTLHVFGAVSWMVSLPVSPTTFNTTEWVLSFTSDTVNSWDSFCTFLLLTYQLKT